MELTERQRQILRFIADYKARHGSGPTLREIAQHLKIYLRGVQYHLDRLERAGYLTRARKRSRAIELRQEQRTALIPLLGRVAAGKPVLSEEHIETSYPLPREWTGNGETFLLKVQGDSMRDARIFDSDLVLVKVQGEALPGEIVVAMVDDEVTVKRFQMDGKRVILKPENEAFTPIRIGKETRFRILGKVIGVFRRL
jgi:repressor LexA